MLQGKLKYFLGLDIGTNSVGWAVTDLSYNVIKKNGKALWGIRLFEEANSAAERRTFRGARRRLQRRKQRIMLLQELFAEEISKKDMGFFQRLRESKLWLEDRSESNKQSNGLFNDDGYKDKDYYQEYPTIYHLRKELAESKEPHDVRLVYLAIHHILKHRGHFLFEGKKLEDVLDIKTVFYKFAQIMKGELEIEWENVDLSELEDVLKQRGEGVTDKYKKLQELFRSDKKDKQKTAILKLLSGSKGIKISDIFNDETLEEYENNKISFSETTSEEKLEKIQADYPEIYYVLLSIKALYDWALLAETLNGYSFLSEAKVAVYKKHNEDLKKLKRVIKKYHKDKYNEIFRNVSENNYCAYVGINSINGKKEKAEKRCPKEKFYSKIKSILESGEKDEEVKTILSEIEIGSFMPLQKIKDNGVIPNQIHKLELERIIENASEYLGFLKEKDENGLSTTDKILGTDTGFGLINYRIPYYVGPLNSNSQSKYTWVCRKKEGKIYPWNFYDIVDAEKSAEKFILRMTNKCTYLVGEDVLPKDSLLYSKFMVLNEINNITVSGEKIPVELKQKIYSELFMKSRNVKRKKLERFFEQEGYADLVKTGEIGGFDGDFKSSLASYADFREISKEGNIKESDFEKIIQYVVLFHDDKKLLKNKIKKEFDYLSDTQIKQIAKLNYKGWGRLSRKFLEEIAVPDYETGEVVSIINHMWNTNDNLMQTLRGELGFKQEIEEVNRLVMGTIESEINYEDVDSLYISPAVKRPVWQAVTIIKELKQILGGDPEKVFIEVTREEREKKRTTSRKQQLLDLYKNCKEEAKDWMAEIENKEEGEFRSNLLFLYYTQMGKDMYTGEPIDLNNLFSGKLYDKDHIWPQSKIKDDSILNNLVLVNKTDNAKKSDQYPLPEEIRRKMKPFWRVLFEKGFITKEKYKRLTRNTAFTNEELADFINRQIVETNQSNKAVADLLKRMFPKASIVYSKAGNVTDFRKKYKDNAGYIKLRELNDYHHAKDAYLNIVVGNVFDTKFTQNPLQYIKESTYRNYSMNRIYDYDVKRGDMTAWISGDQGTIDTVNRWMAKNNILFTRHQKEVKGALFDQNIMKKGKGQVKIKDNAKESLAIEKYGGYNKASGAYFILVESDDKKGRKRTIETVYAYLSKRIESGEMDLRGYCTDVLGLSNPEVLINKIKINTLFEIDGFRMHLSGRTGNQLLFKGAKQLCLSDENTRRLKDVLKFLKNGNDNNLSCEDNLLLYDTFLEILKTTRYAVKLSAQIKTLETGRSYFENMDAKKQARILNEILHLFQCNAVAADLKGIGGPASGGILVLKNNISKIKNIFIIHQSPTGLFEKKITL